MILLFDLDFPDRECAVDGTVYLGMTTIEHCRYGIDNPLRSAIQV